MTRQAKRNRLVRWLREMFASAFTDQRDSQRVIRVEPLENRQLLAADSLRSFLASYSQSELPATAEPETVQVAAFETNESAASAVAGPGEGELTPEGEDAPDLVAFAQALSDAGVRFFGAVWCPFCEQQRALFEDGAQFLDFIEVTNSQRQFNDIAAAENITQMPTWDFPNGTRLEGLQTLEAISDAAEIAIPQSSNPSVVELNDVSVAESSPLHIPIDAYDPNGDPLTITVTSSNPNAISAEVLTGNRSLVLNTDGFGDMVFELFEQRAPVPSGRVIELADAGFYDGIIWHRVINGFVIQGGDPTGTGSGGSTLGDFDDQFNLDLQHNRGGILSYAKGGDDTNDSQFFVTEGPTPHLDFNHSIFGQLVEGERVRDAISNVSTSGEPLNRPSPFEITIESATVFNDTENGVVLLRANADSGSSTITVRIEDTMGNVTEETFVATAEAESGSINGAPFFEPIAPVETTVNTPVSINLQAIDKESDTLVFSATPLGGQNFGLQVDSSTGVVTVTPPQGFTGQLQFVATVGQANAVTFRSDPTDSQLVTVTVSPSDGPTSVNLDAASDTGSSNSDNVTSADTLSFTIGGTVAGALVELRSGGSVVGSATASGTTTVVSVPSVSGLGEGAVAFTARQTLNGNISSDSPALTVVLDQTGPAALLSSQLPSTLRVNTALDVDLQHPEEGQGLAYALTNAPQGMQLSAAGVLTWTPNSTQVGDQTFTIVTTDQAGNITENPFTISVAEEPIIAIRPVALDLNGNPLTSVEIGDTFRVQVRLQDVRDFTQAEGVFSAAYDVLFDPAIVEVTSQNPITYFEPYTAQQRGTVGNGIIDEVASVSTNISPLGGSERAQLEIEFRALQAGNPNIRLDPPDINGSENLVYFVDDVIPNSRVDFGSVNLAVGLDFSLADDTFNFDEDSGQQTLNVLSNDTNNTNLTISGVGEAPSGAQIQIGSDGRSILYTPAANFSGGDSFVYRAQNSSGVELEATVTVQMTDVNDPPLALNDTFSVADGSNNNILEVLSNDSTGVDDPGSENLRITAVSAGSNNGAIVIASSGLSINYSPATGFSGTETFTYTLSDGRGGEATGTVSVEVTPDNPPPVANNDSFSLDEDDTSATFDVLANDTTDDPTETLSVSDVTASSRGSLFQVSSDGLSVTYQPAANFSGTEILAYTLRDSNGAESEGAVTFTVNAVNDPPIAVDDSATVIAANASTEIDVLANDSTVDTGETLSVSAVTQPTTGNGTVEISSNGQSITYRPPSSEFVGTVTFSYTLSDGNGLTAEADVTLEVEDFLPRAISGSVTNASQTDGFQLDVQLTGTDITGATINRTASTDGSGFFSFGELAPGDYVLQRDSLPFLNDEAQSIPISSAVTDGDVTSDIVVSGTLRAQHFDIRDFLGSTFTNNLLVAVADDGTAAWSRGVGEWSTLSNLEVTGDSGSLQIAANNDSDERLEGTFELDSSTRAYVAGREGAHRLVRIRGTPELAGLAVNTAGDGGSAEGESNAGIVAPQIQAVRGNSIASQTPPIRRPLSSVDQAIHEEFGG